MKCLFSTSINSEGKERITDLLHSFGFQVDIIYDKKDCEKYYHKGYDLLLSDRTSFLFKKEFLESNNWLAINTHPSLLPKHRGSHSLFWGVILGELHGITIHLINTDIDRGQILFQKVVDYYPHNTFREVYNKSRKLIEIGIEFVLKTLSENDLNIKSYEQGVCDNLDHKKNEVIELLKRLPNGWDTSIEEARSILCGYKNSRGETIPKF